MDGVFFNEKPLLMTLGLELPGHAHGPFINDLKAPSFLLFKRQTP